MEDHEEKKVWILEGKDTKSATARRERERKRLMLQIFLIIMIIIMGGALLVAIGTLVYYQTGISNLDFTTPRIKASSPGKWAETYRATKMSFSPDGQYLYTQSMEDAERIWCLNPTESQLSYQRRKLQDSSAGDEVQGVTFKQFPKQEVSISCVALTNTHVFQGMKDAKVRVWEINRLYEEWEKPTEMSLLSGMMDSVGVGRGPREWDTGVNPTSLAVSPDGLYALTGTDENWAILWDAQAGTKYNTVTEHSGSVTSGAISLTGSYYATGGTDGRVCIWNMEDDALIKGFRAHESEVSSIHFSRDGKKILTSGRDYSVSLWDVQTGTLLQKFIASVEVGNACFTLDEKNIISNMTDTSLVIWDIDTGKRVGWLDAGSVVLTFAVRTTMDNLPQRETEIYVATGENGIRLFKFSTPERK